MIGSNTSLGAKVRITTAFKARSADTGDFRGFSEGSILWHVEVGEETTRFKEIGEQGVYEIETYEFTSRVKKLSR